MNAPVRCEIRCGCCGGLFVVILEPGDRLKFKRVLDFRGGPERFRFYLAPVVIVADLRRLVHECPGVGR